MNKNKQNKNIGASPHLRAQNKVFEIEHIQGIMFVDFKQKIYCKISGETITFFDSEGELLSLNFSEIENAIIFEEIEKTKKKKSIIARAIVGGLLFGDAGAVIGGISALCPSIKEIKKYYLELSVPGYDSLIISTDNKSLQEIKIAITS